MSRWIKLYDSILEWEWHDDPMTVSIAIHLLLMAKPQDTKYRGRLIRRGQLEVKVTKLATYIGMSHWQIRTRIERLKECGFLITETTNKKTLITISNYESYQEVRESEPQSNHNQTTIKPQSNHKRTELEYKNIINTQHTQTCAREEEETENDEEEENEKRRKDMELCHWFYKRWNAIRREFPETRTARFTTLSQARSRQILLICDKYRNGNGDLVAHYLEEGMRRAMISDRAQGKLKGQPAPATINYMLEHFEELVEGTF